MALRKTSSESHSSQHNLVCIDLFIDTYNRFFIWALKLLLGCNWLWATAELSWVRMCYDLVISRWCRQILCLAWITFAVRDTYQPPEPSTAADQSWNLIIQSLLSPSLSLSHPLSLLSLSPFPLPPLLFPFLLFESDTQSILITFKSEERHDQMLKRLVSKTAVVSFCFTVWPLDDYSTASIGYISRGSWVAAVSCWRWPCVLQS